MATKVKLTGGWNTEYDVLLLSRIKYLWDWVEAKKCGTVSITITDDEPELRYPTVGIEKILPNLVLSHGLGKTRGTEIDLSGSFALLPNEVLENIWEYFSPQDLIQTAKVCKGFRTHSLSFLHSFHSAQEEWNETIAEIQRHPDQCRFFFTNFPVEDHKPIATFLSWAPDDAPTRQKMLYTSCISEFLNVFKFQFCVQATDADEIQYDYIFEKLLRTGSKNLDKDWLSSYNNK